MGQNQQEARLNTLLAYFIGESEEYRRLEIPERREEKRNLLRSLMNVRMPRARPAGGGRHWGKPMVAFPEYKAPQGVGFPKPYYGYIMHQRMGFYHAPNGKLLVVGFYGHSYDPFKEGGIGRGAREVRKDGTMGPIHFIRYSSHAQWNASNTAFPFYTSSKDKAFKAA